MGKIRKDNVDVSFKSELQISVLSVPWEEQSAHTLSTLTWRSDSCGEKREGPCGQFPLIQLLKLVRTPHSIWRIMKSHEYGLKSAYSWTCLNWQGFQLPRTIYGRLSVRESAQC